MREMLCLVEKCIQFKDYVALQPNNLCMDILQNFIYYTQG